MKYAKETQGFAEQVSQITSGCATWSQHTKTLITYFKMISIYPNLLYSLKKIIFKKC